MSERLPKSLRGIVPPYTRKPLALPDGTPVFGWSGPAVPTAPTCKCSHARRQHGTDRRDRATCFGSSMCACTTYRPEDTE